MDFNKLSRIEKKIVSLRKHVSMFKDSEETATDKHGIWSIKKTLILYDYVKPFIEITRSNGYKTLHYVDFFAGSGFFKVRNKLMPGTPLIPLLEIKDFPNKKNQFYFDEYIFSDKDPKYVDLLKARIEKLKADTNSKIIIQKNEFSTAIRSIFSGIQPTNDHRYDHAYLVVLDPYGFQVEWNHLEHILRSGAVDVILTFPSTLANWNKTKSQSRESLTKLFGNEEWIGYDDANEFVKKYCEKISNIEIKWGLKTKPIIVQAGNQTYHIICVSRSGGANNVFSAMQGKYNDVDENMLNRLFAIAAEGQKTLFDNF